MEKFETPPDSSPVIVIDPDDQPMWSSTRTVDPTPSFAIIQLPISDNFHIKAKTWLNELDERTITSWNELREAFISRYFYSPKFRHLLNEIHIFHQFDNESLVDAWLRLKEMLRTCYGHGLTKGTIIQTFYRGLDSATQGILSAGGIFLYNTPNEAFKILEDKTEANERMKNYVAELERKINQGLRNCQAIIKNLERQFEFLDKEIQHSKSLPHDVLLNHVGNEELKSIDGVGTGRITKKNDDGVSKEPNKE
ncbi:reverse transcriptase domain-containing protein [Tanacetum coccineum]